ncbi:MAG: enoyl-CoA hydratase/isomerase family protein, partial [Acetobacteraceae bacterium]|nr:enoyl-CoA hydratase/isomerase family protein [Acetobacteraceae bacterium]
MGEASSSCVLVEVAEDGVALVTLNRPESRNPLDPEVQDALVAAVLRLDADPGVRVMILTGAGSAFSAGGNVRRMGAA